MPRPIINLPHSPAPGVSYAGTEKEYFSKDWNTEVITNVSKPTLEVFEPSKSKKNGTSVIISPGGGLYALSINSEGRDVAAWLVSKGITAFVLKYRLVPTKEDGVKENNDLWEQDPELLYTLVKKVLPTSIQDGLNAIEYVRTNATHYALNTNKIGFMGFSAGGAVTMGVGYHCKKDTRPDFLVPIYPWTDVQPVSLPHEDMPPMLVICATDDELELARGAIELYSSMLEKEGNVALHLYSKGRHGFGMKKQGLPSDNWIERFYEWGVSEGLIQEQLNHL